MKGHDMYDWKKCIASFREAREDCFTLISHASYLFRTNGVCWALDPRLDDDMHLQADDMLPEAFGEVRFALLTHLHGDHYDKKLIQSLSGLDITWVFPDFLPPEEQDFVKEYCAKRVFVHAGQELTLCGVTVRVFESNHSDVFEGKLYSVPEYGYAVCAGKTRLLFPGDVRDYGDRLPGFTGADVFGHIWLGRKAALTYTSEMLAYFCDFLLSCAPRRVILAHLYDWNRSEKSMWTEDHAQAVRQIIAKKQPGLPVLSPAHGQTVLLDVE